MTVTISGTSGITTPGLTDTGNATIAGTLGVTGNTTAPNLQGPAFSAYQSVAQTLASSTFTKITFTTVQFDTNSNYSSSRFTPTVAGYYQISGGIAVASSSTAIFFYAYKNGALEKDMGGVGGTVGAASGSALIYLNGSTDYVELYGYFGTGQNTNPGIAYTYFQGVLVRSA